MALYDLQLMPGVKRWSGRLFKDLVRVFDRYPNINEPCINELKELFPGEFAISNQQLKEDYDLRKVKYLGSKIRIQTKYDFDIQALAFSQKNFTINYKQEPYLEKVLLSSINKAVKYSANKPEIQEKLKAILLELNEQN